MRTTKITTARRGKGVKNEYPYKDIIEAKVEPGKVLIIDHIPNRIIFYKSRGGFFVKIRYMDITTVPEASYWEKAKIYDVEDIIEYLQHTRNGNDISRWIYVFIERGYIFKKISDKTVMENKIKIT